MYSMLCHTANRRSYENVEHQTEKNIYPFSDSRCSIKQTKGGLLTQLVNILLQCTRYKSKDRATQSPL